MIILKILSIIGIMIGIIISAYLLLLIISSLLVDTKKEYEVHSRFYRWLLNSATGIAFILTRTKIHVTGLEHIPKQGRFLLVGNHRSNYDPLVTWYVLRQYDLAFISKAANFKIPFFGRLIRKCCFMTIDRENPKNAMQTIQKATRLIEQDEVSVAVYPEGTRNTEEEMLPFHNGVFKIAQKAKVPIVIAAIRGTECIHKNIPWRRSHVYLDILETLPTDYVTSHKTAEIGDYMRMRIQPLLHNEEENHS